MDRTDLILLAALAGMALLSAALRIGLARRQGKPLSAFWTAQSFVFPALLLLSLLLLGTGRDLVLPAVAVGLLQEIVFSVLRRRMEKAESQDN